jgi:MinD superfamily P-loop ATPase
LSNIKSDRKNQYKVVTAISTPLIESQVIRSFTRADWRISERLFDLNNFVGEETSEVILILTPDQKSKKEICAAWVVGIGSSSDQRWKRFKPDLIISPEEVETLPAKLLAKIDDANCTEVMIGATEILFLGTKGSPGTSTIAWNYAGELARTGRKILLAEENVNGTEGALFFGFDDQSRGTSIFTAITIRPNYDLLCNSLVRSKIEITTPQKWIELRRKCQEKYEQIVIDGGVLDFEDDPSLQSFLINRAEKIFLIGQDDIFSLLRLKMMVDYVKGLTNSATVTIVLNKSKANPKIAKHLMKSNTLDILFIPQSEQLFAECIRDGVLVSEVKGSKAAEVSAQIKRLHS